MILTLLEPPLPPNLSLTSVLSPRSNSLAIFPASTSISTINNSNNKNQKIANRPTIYFAQYDSNQLESREFLIETFTLFDSLQKIAREAIGNVDGFGGYRSSALVDTVGPTQIQYFHRISRLYREVIAKQFKIIEGDSELDEDAKLISLAHHATLHGILSLSEILYLPSDGMGDGVVGEEILDWVNTVDRAPSAEEGQELLIARPWEHSNFWPYIYTCILRAHLLSVSALLELVLTHPSPYLQSLASIPRSLLSSFPRSTNYTSEQSFLRSLTEWKQSLKRSLLEMEDLYSSAIHDPVLGGKGIEKERERGEWESGFRCLMELMEGREKRVLEVSEDWREALGSWGIWVNPGGRREGLPETMTRITRHHPVDTTLPVESVQASLILGDVPRALQQSNLLSIWLVAHLSDLLQKVSVLDESIPSGALSLRDHFVLSYTELLLADPSLWRIVVEYLSTCGEQGRGRMRLVLLGVDLGDEEIEEVGGGMEVDGSSEGESKKDKKFKIVDDVLRVCSEQGLDEELKSICKVYSEQLISQKRYGEAVSYCVKGDGKRIARITERVLEEYIVNGQEAFIHHVDSIPTSLLRPNTSPLALNLNGSDRMDEQEEVPLTPYSSRLSFLARYRDFFALYARGERRQAATLLVLLFSSNVAPKSFYAVMLLDVVPLLEGEELIVTTEEVYELLRCLEEVTANISTSGDIYGYLNSLARIVGGNAGIENGLSKKDREVKALRQLEVVRGALARTLGRCFAAAV